MNQQKTSIFKHALILLYREFTVFQRKSFFCIFGRLITGYMPAESAKRRLNRQNATRRFLLFRLYVRRRSLHQSQKKAPVLRYCFTGTHKRRLIQSKSAAGFAAVLNYLDRILKSKISSCQPEQGIATANSLPASYMISVK